MDMKRLRAIEKDFVLKPNPYVTEEQANSLLWKLAVGEVLAISAFTCFTLSFLKVRPAITLANSFKNFTYFQATTSIATLFYHLYELDELGNSIPTQELTAKINTYDQRYK
jgi:hypothetical protein